jgi:hypothetical protein
MKYTNKNLLILTILLFWNPNADAKSPRKTEPKMNHISSIPYQYTQKTFITLPVTVGDSVKAPFILDTGIGLNLVSKSICEKLNCKTRGTFTGKRMSGQEIKIPLSSVPALSITGLRVTDVPVGVLDMEELMPGAGIGGFLSLGFFRNQAFTIDYKQKVVVIETKESLSKIKTEGTITPIRLAKHDDALDVFLILVLPNAQNVSVEVDTGSQTLILDERFMAALGVSPSVAAVQRRDGQDETGHSYARYFTKIHGSVHLPQNPNIKSEAPEVMFQKIIYDGLVGHHFLSQFRVTYNLPESEMIFRNLSQ